MNVTTANKFTNLDPWISLLLGILIFPGFGQIYNGKPKQGIFLWLFSLFAGAALFIVPVYFSKSIITIAASLIAVLFLLTMIVVSAFFQCKRLGSLPPRQWYNKPWGVICIWIILYFLSGHLGVGIQACLTYFVKTYQISASSMSPTLLPGDMFFVKKAYYGLKVPFNDDQMLLQFRRPQRGDVIVFKFPKDERKDFIKRVIGIPGDTIEVKEKEVYLNGKKIEEPYVIHDDPGASDQHSIPERDNYGPFLIPADSYFVMGDNRDHSLDSRFWGPVSLNKIKGSASIIYASRDVEHSNIRWERVGKPIE